MKSYFLIYGVVGKLRSMVVDAFDPTEASRLAWTSYGGKCPVIVIQRFTSFIS